MIQENFTKNRNVQRMVIQEYFGKDTNVQLDRKWLNNERWENSSQVSDPPLRFLVWPWQSYVSAFFFLKHHQHLINVQIKGRNWAVQPIRIICRYTKETKLIY